MTPSRILILAAAIAAPIFFVAGQALLPNLGRDTDTAFSLMLEYRHQLIVSRLLTTAGAYLLLPALWLIAGLGGKMTVAGAAVAAIGTFFNAVSQAVQGYAAWGATAPGLDHKASMQTLLHLEDGPAGVVVSYWSIPLFGIGLVLLSVGLLISGSAPRWMPSLLLAGVALGFATAGLGPIVALTQAPLVIALISLVVYKSFSLAPQPATVHNDA